MPRASRQGGCSAQQACWSCQRRDSCRLTAADPDACVPSSGTEGSWCHLHAKTARRAAGGSGAHCVLHERPARLVGRRVAEALHCAREVAAVVLQRMRLVPPRAEPARSPPAVAFTIQSRNPRSHSLGLSIGAACAWCHEPALLGSCLQAAGRAWEAGAAGRLRDAPGDLPLAHVQLLQRHVPLQRVLVVHRDCAHSCPSHSSQLGVQRTGQPPQGCTHGCRRRLLMRGVLWLRALMPPHAPPTLWGQDQAAEQRWTGPDGSRSLQGCRALAAHQGTGADAQSVSHLWSHAGGAALLTLPCWLGREAPDMQPCRILTTPKVPAWLWMGLLCPGGQTSITSGQPGEAAQPGGGPTDTRT